MPTFQRGLKSKLWEYSSRNRRNVDCNRNWPKWLKGNFSLSKVPTVSKVSVKLQLGREQAALDFHMRLARCQGLAVKMKGCHYRCSKDLALLFMGANLCKRTLKAAIFITPVQINPTGLLWRRSGLLILQLAFFLCSSCHGG